jgi:hypothetical protein
LQETPFARNGGSTAAGAADPIMLITPSHRDHRLRLDDCQWSGADFVSDTNIAFSEE